MECKHITIAELKDLYRIGRIELNPPYQRRPVWKFRQRQLLLNSIFNGIPMPAVIFNERLLSRGQIVYDVLDGKQRIETILQFIELIEREDEKELLVKKKTPAGTELLIGYDEIKSARFNKENNGISEKFWQYRIPMIVFPGEVVDFLGNPVPTMEIFVRINSTGSPLKQNEIRHASTAGPFFKLGDELESKYKRRFTESWRIFSSSDIQRYVFHEFIMELCTAIYFGKYTDKRKRLDDLLRNNDWDTKKLAAVKKRFEDIVKWMTSIFSDPVFNASRFKAKSDFYSLFVVLNEFIEKGAITSNNKGNKILGKTLLEFSKSVQTVSPKLKKYAGHETRFTTTEKELLQYVIATREATDTMTNREMRHNYLMRFVKGFVTESRDRKRLFDTNVKGVLWTNLYQKSQKPKCPNPHNNVNCKKLLSEDNAQVDHIYPWVRGGKTVLENARLICDSCNRSKGASV